MSSQSHSLTTSSSPSVSSTDMANAIRFLSMDAVEKAQSGHPGMPMGMAEVATILFTEFLKYDPLTPQWPDRDRFVLSAGHGSMLLYSLLYLTGYPDMTLEELQQFRQLGAKTAGHPEYGHATGIETTTGPLGQGIGNAVGMAIAEAMLAEQFGQKIVDHFTYVIAGDGCLMEGISHEAMSLAGHLKLRKLVLLFDDNRISIDGPTSLTVSDDHLARAASYGWRVEAIDGHDAIAIRAALQRAQDSDKPSFIACRTTIGKGAPSKAGTAASHGSPLGNKEIEGTRQNLQWQHSPFVIPAPILDAWREAGRRHHLTVKEWQQRLTAAPQSQQSLFQRLMQNQLPEGWEETLLAFKKELTQEQPKEASRKSSGRTLLTLSKAIPELLGGSADLTGSNDTKTAQQSPISATKLSGSYIHYGVREHAMGAIMNGITLHKGFIPYGGTFLVFSDYCRPAIRLSALMGLRVIYVMTHDSIGLGEDGPTHQPVEHLASLRAIPNLLVLRPADAIETLECWQIALKRTEGPSLLVLTRQSLPTVRTHFDTKNLCEKGAYILSETEGKTPEVTLFASGSEIAIALEAKHQLEQDHHLSVRLVSVTCMELFFLQSKDYITSLLCNSSLKIAVEAAISMGWERFIGPHGIFIGMHSFGASAPAEILYQHFGISAEQIVKKALHALKHSL